MFHPDMMTDTLAPRGYKANFDFDKYVLSIVQNEMSYGAAQGFYEISIFENDNQIELPGITDEGDAVKGWLTIEDVNSIIKKLTTITGVNAKLL
tara:strand:- start:1427 stop:1708 length:282 start_codon:yes stop_codon:yes gene_type:complete